MSFCHLFFIARHGLCPTKTKTLQLYITACDVRLGPQTEDAELALSTPKPKEPGTIGAGDLIQGLLQRQLRRPHHLRSLGKWREKKLLK